MAISGVNLTGTSATSGPTITSASTTLNANRLGLLTVCSVDNTSTSDPTIGGTMSATWVQVGSVITIGSFLNLWTYRAMEGSNQTGTVSADFGADSQFAMTLILDEFDGVDTGGTSGSAAVVQSTTGSATSGTALSATLASFADATNNVAYGIGVSGIVAGPPTLTPGTGFTELDEQQANGPSTADCGHATEWKTGEDTSVDMTSDTDTEWAFRAIEIAIAPGGTVLSAMHHYKQMGSN